MNEEKRERKLAKLNEKLAEVRATPPTSGTHMAELDIKVVHLEEKIWKLEHAPRED